jgi:hypothetical protein
MITFGFGKLGKAKLDRPTPLEILALILLLAFFAFLVLHW